MQGKDSTEIERGIIMEEEEPAFVVCGQRAVPGDELPRKGLAEFHKVFLGGKGKVVENAYPPLLSSLGAFCLVALPPPPKEGGGGGPTVYVVGGLGPGEIGPPNDEDDDKLVLYPGGCRLVDGDPPRWERIQTPIHNGRYSTCAVHQGKIYCFACYDVDPEVFDPLDGNWHKSLLSNPPHSLRDLRVYRPVLPHPSQHRILIHLSDGSLWAFYPPTRLSTFAWELVASHFDHWGNVVALYENLIFIHDFYTPSSFFVYDLDTSKWLDVVWSSETCINIGYNITSVGFDSLQCVGDGVFWAASWSPSIKRNEPVYIYFLKFKAEYVPATSTIRLTPLTSQMHPIPGNITVNRFLLLPP
ncbi:unnamed protein product [Cuscuta campestris]|uniref:F-box associated domain-containing protein n=1 Tax=Cuscuta campestris TaxID=132261 RepID=A0A484MYB6_9ASTE|nr:unnamed protein product [Cuscuta campestris]